MRETIQNKLEEITNVETSAEIPDELLSNNVTYFSYSISENYEDRDFEREDTRSVNITGYVKRLKNTNENTLEYIDDAVYDIIEKLKELNFKCSYNDVSAIDNLIKIRIIGNARYNEINNKLI